MDDLKVIISKEQFEELEKAEDTIEKLREEITALRVENGVEITFYNYNYPNFGDSYRISIGQNIDKEIEEAVNGGMKNWLHEYELSESEYRDYRCLQSSFWYRLFYKGGK